MSRKRQQQPTSHSYSIKQEPLESLQFTKGTLSLILLLLHLRLLTFSLGVSPNQDAVNAIESSRFTTVTSMSFLFLSLPIEFLLIC